MGDDVAARRREADVAVVGAGPAGIAAAATAAAAGRSVVVVDESPRAGGQIWRHTDRAALPRPARRWLERLERSGATLLTGTTVVDATPELELALQGAEACTLRAGAVVLAAGARERFLPFPGWTLPNVLGVGGAQALLKAGTSFRGKRVVIAGSGPLLLPVASALRAGGARVEAVAEQAPAARVIGFARSLWRSPGRLVQAARYRATFLGTPYRLDTWVTRADGDDRLREATLTDGRRSWTIPCDYLCVGFGLVPNLELPRLLGCAVEDAGTAADTWQRTSQEGILCAGEASGIGGMEAALLEGEVAGWVAAGHLRRAERLFPRRDRARAFAARMEAAFAPREELRHLAGPDTVVCRCEDVRLGELRPEWSARQAKLYTRAGMGPCQGRVCGAALQHLFGWDPPVVRPPAASTTVGALIPPDPPHPAS